MQVKGMMELEWNRSDVLAEFMSGESALTSAPSVPHIT